MDAASVQVVQEGIDLAVLLPVAYRAFLQGERTEAYRQEASQRYQVEESQMEAYQEEVPQPWGKAACWVAYLQDPEACSEAGMAAYCLAYLGVDLRDP